MSTTELIINTYEDLKNFRDSVNNRTNTYETVKLGADIDMNGDDWTPIGLYNDGIINTFSGTFDGQGHVISNMKINIADTDILYLGLFGYSANYINNLILDNPIIYNSTNNVQHDKTMYVSFLCGYNSKTANAINSCRIINGHININNTGKSISNVLIGCICSHALYSTSNFNIIGCYVEVELNIKGNILPDIGGIARNNGFLNKCGVKITGIIDLNLKHSPRGIIINGLTTLNNTSSTQVTNCYVNMNFKFSIYARTITRFYAPEIYGIGYKYSGTSKPTISNCYVISNIELNTSIPDTTTLYYYTSSNAASTTKCYSLVNLLLRQYGVSSNIQLIRNSETLKYSVIFANDTQYQGPVSYTGTYTQSNTLEDDLLSGKICYLLNNNLSDSNKVNFYQSLNFDKYPVLDNRHYIVNYNSTNETYSNTSNTNYIYDIWTYDDLMQFKASVNIKGRTAYENKTVNLHRDFDLNNEKWTPILWFFGTFNGNGHKITNFYMDLADVYLVNSGANSSYGLSFIAAAKINNFSIETTIKGTFPKQKTNVYLAALAYKGSCENVNVFVTFQECNISINDQYNFYCGGICAIKYSDSNNSFNHCKLHMYLRNCKFTISNNTVNCRICIYGICYDCVSNNNTVLLSIDNTNTISNVRTVHISGISRTGDSTKCNSYVNCNIDITYLTLGGISSANCNIVSCFSFVNFKGTLNSSCAIGGLAGSDIGKIQKSYCVAIYNITINGSYCNIGGICGSALYGSSTYITNCYVDANIKYTTNDTTTNRIGFISVANATNDTVYYTGSISNTSSTGSITPVTFGIRLSDDAFKSGEVCYKLNNAIGSTVFYQSIGSNYYPTFNSNEWEVLYDSSQEKPYYNKFPSSGIRHIKNLKHLILFRNLINSKKNNIQDIVTLDVDIDLNGEEWIPIGTATSPFNGTFDGQNHKISNFKCYANNHLNQVGLFGNATYEIKNLTIENVFIGEQINTNQESDFGSLLGCLTRDENINKEPSINYCYANNCKILIYEFNRDYEFHVGGLVGNVNQSNIAFCGIKNGVIDIYGGSYIGGLIGWGNDTGGKIYDSYSEVDITFQMANTNFGCILGGLCCNNFITEYCYSINTIKVTNLINGKVNGLNSLGTCNNCHVTTNIDVEINNNNPNVTSINGLCGYFKGVSQYNYIDATITYNILKKTGDIKVSLNSEDSKAYNYAINDRITNKGTITPTYTYQGKPYHQLINAYQFRNGYVCYNINTDSVASIKQSPFYQTLYSDPYPVLDSTHQPVRKYDNNFYNTLYVLSSYDTINFFYQILDTGYSYENEIVEVSNNIDCNSNKLTPSTKAFKGTLEGNNYIISKFELLTNETEDSGFIANNQGTIQNLKLDTITIYDNGVLNSYRNIGFICGNSSGLITNCHVTNGVIDLQYISYFANIGGICGWYNSGSSVNPISKCSTNIKVNNIITSSNKDINIGGIIGTNGSGSIDDLTKISISYCCSIIDCNLNISNDSAYYAVGGISAIANNINNSYSVVNFNVQSTGQNSNVYLGGIFGRSNTLKSMLNVYTDTTITYSRSYSNGSFYIGNIVVFNTSSYKSNVYAVNNKVTNLGSYEYTRAYITDDYYTPIIKRDFTNGTICYGLNNNQSTNPVFYQRINLDEYPLLINSTSIVKRINGIYASAEIGITNYQELKNIATLTNNGSFTYSKVYLLNDIDMNNYVNGETWTPIGTSAHNFKAYFYGNYHTIYNMIINAANHLASGFFGYVNRNIYDLIIDDSCKIIVSSNSTITASRYFGMLYGYAYSSCDVYRCTIKGYIDIKNVSGTLSIGGLGYISATSYTYHCNIEPIITVESNFDQLINIGGAIQKSTYRIYNCNIHPSINVINNVKDRKQNINIGGVVVNNDSLNNDIVNTFCDTHINIIDPYYTSSSTYYKLNTILNGTTTSKSIYSLGNLISINNQLFIESEANKKYTDISVDQVKNGYLCYNILGNQYWRQNLREDYYPTLDITHQQVTRIIDNKVYINKKYNINSYNDFINFRNEINGITSNVSYSCDFYLNCDINLNNIDWIPINYNKRVTFSGTFYGNNHSISKLSINHGTYQWTGLFGCCIGLKFKDLIIKDSTLTVIPKSRTAINGASFLGYGITTIDNCHVIDSSINMLNGFNTDNYNEIYAGLGISLSRYQSQVVNCTNCSVILTYDVVETITRTIGKYILMSGIISNTVNDQNSSANISYTENVFSNCYANITFNRFDVVTMYYFYGCICSDFNYVKVENCHSDVETKDTVIITGASSGSLAWHNFAGIIMEDTVIGYGSNKYYANVYVNKCWSNITYYTCLVASCLTGIVYNNPYYAPARKSTFANNCYSVINHNYHSKIYSGEDVTLGIMVRGNASNCYSVIKCHFAYAVPMKEDCVVKIGGIAEQRDSSLTVTNNYGYVSISGGIKDGTSSNYSVNLYIGGILASDDTSIKSSNYAVSYTTDEIKNSLSGTKYTVYNYCTTSYVTAITSGDFTNGKVCYGLNGNQSNINFYQYLKYSIYPKLDSNYPKVLLKNSSYINQEVITEINSKYDLFLFRDSVNAGNNYVNTTININVDIDLEQITWTPIYNVNYDGILQGNGHVISNFKIENQRYCGIFGVLYDDAEIHNLTLDNVTIQGSYSRDNLTSYCGVLCGYGNNINMSNCNITNCKIDIEYSSNDTSTNPIIYIGGLFGKSSVYSDNKGKITNCNVTNTSIKITLNSDKLTCYVGGLFADILNSRKTQLSNSSFIGNITIDNKNGINTSFNYISGLCISSTDIKSCYTVNNINIINGRNICIVGISGIGHTITNTFCKSIINVSSYTTTTDSILINGIAYSDVSTSNINNVYADNQIFYNNQTTDATKIKIGQITSNTASTVTNSNINIVPNQIINLGTTQATINDKVTGYNTIRKEDFRNGKVCYGLNKNGIHFYQIIGMDDYPVLTNNNSTIKELHIAMYFEPFDMFYYNNDFDGNIYSYYDLCLFRNLVNSGTNFQGQTINLLCDIDINGNEWIPIGCVFDKPFMGSFNGNNHVIKNMVLRLNLSLNTTANYRCIGLFGDVGDVDQSDSIVIKDIIIDKTCSMKYDEYTGDIYCSYLVGRLNKGTIDNCKIYADVRLNNASNLIYYGSFAGDINSNNCIISNCYVNNNIVTNNMNTMLIFAIAANTNTISNEDTTKYLNNCCIINVRMTNDKVINSIGIIGLSRELDEKLKETINANNYVNNCLLMNTTILDDIAPTNIIICYSIEQLNSNNYVNNDYPFIKKQPTTTTITLGVYLLEFFKSGKICYLLNGNQSNIKFYQNLEINKDIAPIPDNSHQQVYRTAGTADYTYYNRPLNELPTQQLAVTTYNLSDPTLLSDFNPSNNNLYQSVYYTNINFALITNNSVYSVTESIKKYIYDIYHSSKNYKLDSMNLMYFKFQLMNEIIQKKLSIGDVIMYNKIFAKLVNNLPIELVKTELNYYKRMCFYLRDKNALDNEHYNLIFGDNQ